jgi:DNA polymerase elongation subunit (family B)
MALLREYHRVVLNYIFEMITDLIRGEKIDPEEFVLRERVGTSYKSKNAPMKLFAEHLTEIGKPPEHGEMLSYVVCDIEGVTAVGQRFRDLDEFRLGGHRLDYLYYMKIACSPIDKLWATAYPNIDGKYSAPISAVQRTFMKSSKTTYQQVIREWKETFGC